MELLVDGNRGIYVPQFFAQNYLSDPQAVNVSAEDAEILKGGPDNDLYWEAWEEVERVYNDNGKTIFQESGDLWLLADGEPIPSEMI